MRGIVLLILLFSLAFSGEDFEKICTQEVEKNDFNISLIRVSCLKTGDFYFNQNNYEESSWFYLLSQKNKKNIKLVLPKISVQKNLVAYANIAHSYVLESNLTEAKRLYRSYINIKTQPNIEIQADYKLLFNLFPKKGKQIKSGLRLWNKIYKPLLQLDELYEKYDKQEAKEAYQEAILTLQKIISLRKNYSNVQNQLLAIDYSNLSLLYADVGQNYRALDYALMTLAIDKNFEKEETHTLAIDYSNLGYIYERLSKYKKAEESYKHSLNISKKIKNSDKHEIATTYNNLAFLYSSMGNYHLALNFYLKSLQIDKKNLSNNDASFATTYVNIGELYVTFGEYPKALYNYNKALTIELLNHDENHLTIANIYNNLAQVYELLEDYQHSKELYEKALKIAEAKLKNPHPFLATIHGNLGNLYYVMEDDEASLKEHLKALSMREILAQNQPSIDLTLSYHALGLLYMANEEYTTSIKYFEKVLELNQKLLSENNIANAVTYSSLGTVYQKMGNHKKALAYQLKALNLEKNIFGKKHKDLAITYNSLSLIYFSMKEYRLAYKYIKKSFTVFNYNKNQNFTILNTAQKRDYTKQHQYRISNLLYLTNLNRSPKTLSYLIKHWLNYKGTLFEYQNILSMVKNNPKTPQKVKESISQLNQLNVKLSKSTQQEEGKKLEKKIHTIEIELSQQNESLKNVLDLNQTNTQQIAKQLKPHQLYIDFARGGENYYLFTLDNKNRVTFQQIDTNRSLAIDIAVKAYRENCKTMANNLSKLTKNQEQKSIKEAQFILKMLHKNIIQKYLSKLIQNKTELIISPDGYLNYFPFEALYHKEHYLVEEYTIHYISSGKEFVRQTKLNVKKPQKEMIVFANANFNAVVKGLFGDEKEQRIERYFDNLGDKEIEVIKKIYPHATLFQDENATIANLMKIPSSKILHLSTHGLFLENRLRKNPLLNAVLIFAGANNNKKASTLTALELSALDLKDTELVVLSACQSGLGEIQNAEGVLGLPKALLQAGAKNVLMSLWRVSNEQTAKLMNYFYANLSKKQPYSTALQNAKLNMIQMHPYFWSAFILSGL